MSRPQFSPRIHRAQLAMRAWAATMPSDLWQRVDQARTTSTPPAHIYLPFSSATQVLQPRGDLSQWAQDCALLTGWGAWRTTQGAYRIDPALYSALIDTPIEGRIPVAALDRLPEWAVYIETPDWLPPLTRGRPVDGVLAWRNRIMEDSVDVLQMILLAGQDVAAGVDYDREVLTLPLADTIDETIARHIAEAEESARMLGGPAVSDSEAAALRATLPPILSLLLYLCADEADYQRPERPQPKRTKQGWRMFAADKLRVWDVGVRLGAALRRAYQGAETEQHELLESGRARPRAHIRRAHWHGYWTGPRDGERRLKVRWMPPLPINVRDEDLPATIREVK